jgi:hypothetical protein
MICDRCNGKKEINIHENKYYIIYEKCYKCLGIGEIDWLTVILEKEQTKIFPIYDMWKMKNTDFPDCRISHKPIRYISLIDYKKIIKTK